MRVPRMDLSRIRYALAILTLIACQTEPSEVAPNAYRLASVDDQPGHVVTCFASSRIYVDGQLVETRDCNVALRDLQVVFDSSRTPAELVATAKVQVDGRDTTWEASAPVLITHDAFRIREGSVPFEEFPPEARYILPGIGSALGGVMTTVGIMTTQTHIVDNPLGGGPFTGTVYTTPRRRVMILTRTGRQPHTEALGSRYAGYSFGGQPASGSTCMPDLTTCFPYLFSATLVSDDGSWTFEYSAGSPDPLGPRSGATFSNLIVRQSGAFVELAQALPGGHSGGYSMSGSFVSRRLTLFPTYFFSWNQSYMPTPIVFEAN